MSDQPDLQVISGRLERGEIDGTTYVEQLMRFVAERIGCSRAGLRLFVDTDEGCVLRCAAMLDTRLDRMVDAADLLHGPASPYLERLQRDGSVCVANARLDPVAAGAMSDYLRTNAIESFMDMSFSVNGVLFGTFSCEQVGAPIDWGQRQLQALRKIASRASLTLMYLVNASVDTAPGALWESSTPNRLVTMPVPLDHPLR
jgi:GAF domain